MITAVAFVPSTPMLIPVVAEGAAHELDDVRSASIDVVRVATDGVDDVVIVGRGQHTRLMMAGIGSLRGFGVDVEIPLGDGSSDEIGLAGTIGLWLLSQAQWQGSTSVQEVTDGDDCRQVGLELAAAPGTRALIIVGDGSAARTEKAPGYLHPDAEAFDAEVERALRTGDGSALASLDAGRSAEVMASGWPAWQLAAACVEQSQVTSSSLSVYAPFGVGYFVALWNCS